MTVRVPEPITVTDAMLNAGVDALDNCLVDILDYHQPGELSADVRAVRFAVRKTLEAALAVWEPST